MDKKKSQHVRVTIVDGSNEQMLVDTVMPAQDLPQSFLAKTTLHIGDQEWEVIEAIPPTADYYLAKGQVKITVVKVARISVKNILFTLPTINDWIPGTNQNKPSQAMSIHAIHEDDWRQRELISLDFHHTIDEELKEVAQIYAEERADEIGFRKCFVRKRIPTPISAHIRLSDVQKHLPHRSQSMGGVAYSDSPPLIKDGFSFDLGKVILYGHQVNGFVQAICLSRGHIETIDSLDAAHCFEQLLSNYQLVLVDWCRMQTINASTDALLAYFQEVFYATT